MLADILNFLELKGGDNGMKIEFLGFIFRELGILEKTFMFKLWIFFI
jgi:hypothetical protein